MEAMAEYANEHGDLEGKPYFAPDGESPVDAEEWSHYRSKFDLEAGVTNVWEEGQVNGSERVVDGTKAKHSNQKPLRLMQRIIEATTDPGDVVWEPFGGLCTGAVAAKQLGRSCRAAEIVDEFYEGAVKRLEDTERNAQLDDVPAEEQADLGVFDGS